MFENLKELIESKNTRAEHIVWSKGPAKNSICWLGDFEAHGDPYQISLNMFSVKEISIDGEILVIVNLAFYPRTKPGEAIIKATKKGHANTLFSIVENEMIDELNNLNIKPNIICLSTSKKLTDNTPEEFERRKIAYKNAGERMKNRIGMKAVYHNIERCWYFSIISG